MKIRIALITCLLALSAGAENLPARFEMERPLAETPATGTLRPHPDSGRCVRAGPQFPERCPAL